MKMLQPEQSGTKDEKDTWKKVKKKTHALEKKSKSDRSCFGACYLGEAGSK